jgi:hypothetical protein
MPRPGPSELPPTGTTQPIESPPQTDRPTAAQLKADIDSGRSGDKIGVFDPGLATLGTDDEAAGRPPSAQEVALARTQEGPERWQAGGRPTGPAHERQNLALYGFVAFIALVAVAFVGVLAIR